MQRIKSSWLGSPNVIIPLLITLLFAVLTVKNPHFIDERLETEFVDYRFKIRNFFSPPPVPDDIIIVAIDAKTYEKFGRWPLSRKTQAELIDKIFKGEPRVVAVDIIHPQSESPEADIALAEVFKKHADRLVVALEFELAKLEQRGEFQGEIEEILYEHVINSVEKLSYLKEHSVEVLKVTLPPEIIADSAPFGHVSYQSDQDGILRWEMLYVKYGEEFFPSLALKAARIAKGVKPMDMRIVMPHIGVDMGGLAIPTDEFGRLFINYYGKAHTIRYESAADVLMGQVPAEVFRDKIVLIGGTAPGTYDQKISPFSADYPGVEKNATVIANIVNENFMQKAPVYMDLLLVLVVGMLSLIISRRQGALHSFLFYAVLTAVFIVTNQFLFTFNGIRINFIYPFFTLLSSGTFIISYKYFIEERSARDVRKIFSNYVTERVVNELIKNPDMARLGGERREVTVLFTDIRGFTTFSERHSPEEVVTMLNEYLGAMTDVIFKWEGTLDKFVGDEILAFWGAPMKQENHAELALRCALHMTKKLDELKHQWQSEGKPALDSGIGINSGEVVVGNIGAEGKKMDYTVIGDHVNLGARVEALTKKYNTHILITEFTFKKIKALVQKGMISHLSIKGLEKVIVKGKEQPISIYEVKPLAVGSKSSIVESDKEGIVRFKEK